jgi:hypothetical protein
MGRKINNKFLTQAIKPSNNEMLKNMVGLYLTEEQEMCLREINELTERIKFTCKKNRILNGGN